MAQSQEQLLEQLRSVPLSDYQLLRKRLVQAEGLHQFLYRLHRDPVKTMSHLADSYNKRQFELTCHRTSTPWTTITHTD